MPLILPPPRPAIICPSPLEREATFPFPIMIGKAGPPLGTLNPADKATGITLSNGNLTATRNDATNIWEMVRSQTSHSSGKYYYEVSIVNKVSNVVAGFANANAPLQTGSNSFPGFTADGIGVVTNGDVWKAGVNTATLGTAVNGNIWCFSLDIGGHLFWVRIGAGNWNGSALANPATGIGGISLPSGLNSGAIFAALSGIDNGASMTANFGSSSFSQTIPIGFTLWG